MEIHSVKSLTNRVIGIIWGDSKTGKTTWACSLPGKKLIINFDPEGFSTVAFRDDVDVIDLSIMTPLDQMKQAPKVATYIVENKDKYDSVIVDSLTTLTESAILDAVERKVGASSTTTKFTPTIDVPGRTAYGARNNTTNQIISKILRATGIAQINCMFIAHADDPQYSDDGKTITEQTIMLGAKIRNTASLKVSEIYHMTYTAGKRMVYLAPFGVKKPMGSRLFDTTMLPRFELKYDINKPDTEQAHSLLNIIKKWQQNNYNKLTTI